MRVYHERLSVPATWWVLGLAMIVVLGAEPAAGFGWLVAAGIYLVLAGGYIAMLLYWGAARVAVTSSGIEAGRARLPLAEAGEVAALDAEQTRALRGPRADPAAFLLARPYLRESVYVEARGPGAGAPYWLIASRRPAELAAAIEKARAASQKAGPVVG